MSGCYRGTCPMLQWLRPHEHDFASIWAKMGVLMAAQACIHSRVPILSTGAMFIQHPVCYLLRPDTGYRQLTTSKTPRPHASPNHCI